MEPGPRPRRLGTAALAAATFFIVSGGPYGLEEVLQAHGYAGGLGLLLALPIVWALPVALLVGELGSALPVTGGYYEWVRRGLGSFWGVQEAWLSIVYTVVDLALYPALLAAYLAQLWPALGVASDRRAGWWLALGMIVACTLWNAAGIRAVGVGSELLGVAVLGPFAAMVALAVAALPGGGLARLAAALREAPPATQGTPWAAGLLLALWNYLGWDNASTFASEVRDAQRAYPRAMLAGVALVTASYVLPVLAAASSGAPAASFATGSWVVAARALGGAPLAAFVVAGGAITSVAMFNAILLAWSRLPAALADDGLLPRALAWRSRTGAPVPALVLGGALVSLCIGLELTRLVTIDVLVYGLALLLEFVALVVLRIREPALARPFRVPGGVPGAVLVGAPPAAILAWAFWRARGEAGAFGVPALGLVAIVVAVGPLAWLAGRRPRAAR